jgi:secretion/DNA translocation related TadE-like protein
MRPEERGAATVVVMAGVGLLMVVALGIGGAEGLLLAHRRAQAAADLAALAGAGARASGGDPCAAAAAVASANEAELRSCAVVPVGVDVVVAVPGPQLLGRSPMLTARARAGPVTR